MESTTNIGVKRKIAPVTNFQGISRRFHKLLKFEQELNIFDSVENLQNHELSHLFQGLKGLINDVKTICKNYNDNIDCFYSSLRVQEELVLEHKKRIESLKLQQDREFTGMCERIKEQVDNFRQHFEEAKTGKFIAESGVLQLPAECLQQQQQSQQSLSLPINLDFLETVDNFSNDTFNANSNFQPQELNLDNLFLPDAQSDVQIDWSLLGDSFEEEVKQNVAETKIITEPDVTKFVEPIRSVFTDGNELKSVILKLFPLQLPLRIQALSVDKQHLIELSVLHQDFMNGKLILQVNFAGKYRDPVRFTSLSQAWLVCSKLCSQNPNLVISPETNVYDLFRLCDDHSHINYSFHLLCNVLFRRLQEAHRRDSNFIPSVPLMFQLDPNYQGGSTETIFPPSWVQAAPFIQN